MSHILLKIIDNIILLSTFPIFLVFWVKNVEIISKLSKSA